jgi:hypothetical protein
LSNSCSDVARQAAAPESAPVHIAITPTSDSELSKLGSLSTDLSLC